MEYPWNVNGIVVVEYQWNISGILEYVSSMLIYIINPIIMAFTINNSDYNYKRYIGTNRL